ncbi:MAG TPA: alpha/beta fold hydrolase [Steroidobacteraceae bacterium]|jgi:pimeloyl-ACP methyl ester carboxylesterase|nr:alpha/beta fold hydrolase [Steroidobacteraceae bacterium]
MSAVAVYVHGLWQTGREAAWLRRRLAQELGVDVRAFTYRSRAAGVNESARALGEYLSTIRADTLHLIGHSMGGLVILEAFELEPQEKWPPGRIVLLGSPLRGSRAARNLARWAWGRKILGRGLRGETIAERERRWTRSRELGVIAGHLGLGLGRLTGPLSAPSDGTVTVAETELDGAADRVVLRVSHTGMMFSAAVARQAAAFLRDGRFRPA